MLTAAILLFSKIVCIGGIFIIFFTYVGFPLVLVVLGKVWGKPRPGARSLENDQFPGLQVLISCYNEADIIEKRLGNVLQQEYPREKLSVLVISDGSTDGSDEIVQRIAQQDPRVALFATGENLGKNEAINMAFRAGAFKQGLLCFTDADSEFAPNALHSAAGFFSSPATGLIGGQVRYWLGDGSAQGAEGFFWKLENLIREQEGALGRLVSCPGQLILMRKELFQPLPAEANTDFALPLSVLAQGYETKFDKNAVVQSLFPGDQREVLKRRQRTVIRALTTISLYRPRLSWQLRQTLFWHKTMRFYMFPVQMWVFIFNIFIFTVYPTILWKALLVLQCLFYGLAAAGWAGLGVKWKMPFITLPYQFTLQNAVIFRAVVHYFGGMRVAKWAPPR